MIVITDRLERTIELRARAAEVFAFFSDAARWASWWGQGSTIAAAAGAPVRIRHPNGVEVAGEVLAAAPPSRISFTYGYVSGAPIPVGSSQVAVSLEPLDSGTRLHLTHEFGDAAACREHVQGWRYHLSVLANLVASARAATDEAAIDAWFAARNEPDGARRASAIEALAAPRIDVADRFSCLSGVEDVLPHLDAMHRFMAGLRIERRGAVRICQGHALVDWVATKDGAERDRGTSLFIFDGDGRIERVVGFEGR